MGPKLGAILASRGIATVGQLLTFFPRTYEDRIHVGTLDQAQPGDRATLALQVMSSRKVTTRYGKTLLEARCTDGSNTVWLKWFHAPRGLDSRLSPGTQLVATGKVKSYLGKQEIIHPELSFQQVRTPLAAHSTHGSTPTESESGTVDYGRIIPIYVEIDGVPSRTLRKVLFHAIERYADLLEEDLPEALLARHGLPPLGRAIREIHFPRDESADLEALRAFRTPSQRRFIFEEFFKFEYLILLKRLKMERLYAQPFGVADGMTVLQDLTAGLPFSLTSDQKTALQEILNDLRSERPMNRLIQGDVGSGKTVVALLSAGIVIAEGGQVALMAPTEILAEQHFKNARKILGNRIRTALLTGKTPQSERTSIFERLASGEPLLLIGTHAVIEDPVHFSNLALTLIDEQHRFGVDQRRKLREKGIRPAAQGKAYPHSLVLTATPIPRTLALTAYGDLSVTTIRELPPGRTPIRTHVVRGEAARRSAYSAIRQQLCQGRQAYFIYPLVKDSEAEGFTHLSSAVSEATRLATEVFPDFRVGLLHGQLPPDEKAKIMEQFSSGELQILVSTTVIEVGVDVPNSTMICIEHAERFGLSQLHQLRGRVGRGHHESTCFLFSSEKLGKNTQTRLETLEETTDGFRIAEADLELRGPGEFLGIRQSGALPFRMADLTRDSELLHHARREVETLLRTDPTLATPQNRNLKRYFEREGQTQRARLTTS